MSAKHTPGPWEAGEHGVHKRHPGQRFAAPVANVFDPDRPSQLTDTLEANIRLIAAAPDLLEAMRGVVRVADRKTVEFDAARAAIAKAEGRGER